MGEAVVPFELGRMVVGDAPPLFYLEILVRTLVVYGYAFVLIRWVGGRGIAQMSTVEFLLVIALGSAVGDAMFYPEVPILHALTVITAVVLLNKGLDTLLFFNRRAERLVDGTTREVVRDGRIDLAAMRALKLGHNELFEALRERGIESLGQVARGYLETSGRFSFFLTGTAETEGLPVVPPRDVAKPPEFGPGTGVPGGVRLACAECGCLAAPGGAVAPKRCGCCGGRCWLPARRADGRRSDPAGR